DRPWGVAGQGLVDQPRPLVGVPGGQREQDLATGGGVQRSALSRPVLGGHSRRAPRLADVDRTVAVQDSDVDGFPELVGQRFADGCAELGEVELPGRGAGEPDDAEADRELATVADLIDEATVLQRRDEPGHGGLVHPQVGGDLGDTRFTVAREQLENADGTIDRLYWCRSRGFV